MMDGTEMERKAVRSFSWVITQIDKESWIYVTYIYLFQDVLCIYANFTVSNLGINGQMLIRMELLLFKKDILSHLNIRQVCQTSLNFDN